MAEPEMFVKEKQYAFPFRCCSESFRKLSIVNDESVFPIGNSAANHRFDLLDVLGTSMRYEEVILFQICHLSDTESLGKTCWTFQADHVSTIILPCSIKRRDKV